ncbi:DUF4185 domain-containing protein [Chitinophaga silvatica]|uniref:DUF4185 domain-containing protein n=1 Tax=Chitinophaga silvatica TaxID=2282649 RepID=A0A3E1YHR2_9BACT|nr:DUF4185 domain-containing protein [Chitinophaga silvatica]RFS26906.1 DUF4185 domain-containing protein [Chitinophaga silvatica]
MKKLILTLAIFSIFNHLGAQDLSTLRFKVEEAPEWSEMFIRNRGWFGGDGIYSIPLNGIENRRAGSKDSILFIFSDSMIGTITGDSLHPGFVMVNNTVGILKGVKPIKNRFQFFWKENSENKELSVFKPATPNTAGNDYYWLGDGFVNQELANTIYIFGYRIRNVNPGAFGFREVGNTLIKIPAGSKPPYLNYEQMDTPFYFLDEDNEIGSYGAGIYVNTKKAGAPNPDGYIYIYGVHGKAKKLVVARVKPIDFEGFGNWRFWNGKSWDTAMNKAADITDRVSNELSVSPLPDGRFALVFQENGMSTSIAMRIGASPVGPFGPVIKLWDCKSDAEEKTYFMYNAKAHPALSDPGELLISYNVNSFDFLKDLAKHPHLYRPRFIRLKLLDK